jgi:hypothetical protein
MRDVENKVITIPFDKGMDQRMPAELSQVGTFRTVENLRLSFSGLLRKRSGTRRLGETSLSGVAPPFVGAGTATDPQYAPYCVGSTGYGNVALVGNSSGVMFQCDPRTECLYPAGAFSTCKPVRRRAGTVGDEQVTGVAYLQDSVATAVNSLGDVMVAAVYGSALAALIFAYIESSDGARLLVVNISATNATRVRLVTVGSVFYLVTLGSSLSVRSFTPGASSYTAAIATITGSPLASSYFDVSPYDSTNWFVVYQTVDTDITIAKMAGTSAASSTTVSVGATPGAVPLSVYANATQALVWVGWHHDPSGVGNVRYNVRNAGALTQAVATTDIATGSTLGPPLFGAYWENPTTSVFFVIGEIISATGVRGLRTGYRTTGGSGNTNTWYGIYPISKPDEHQRFWVMEGIDESTFTRHALFRQVDAGASQMVLELAAPRGFRPDDTMMPGNMSFQAIAQGADADYFAFPFMLTQRGDYPVPRANVYEYIPAEKSTIEAGSRGAFVEPMGLSSAVSGQPTEFLSHAHPQGFTGSAYYARRWSGAAEIGFVDTPVIISESVSSGTIEPGTYVYRVVQEWIDMYGQRHQSAPSEPVSALLTTNSRVDLTIAENLFSQRDSDSLQPLQPYYVVYRTLEGGENSHRVETSTAGSSSGTITLRDDSADSVISDAEFLYTEGGVLQNDLAPSCRFMRFTTGRLWCGGLWEPNQLECSKIRVPDEQIAFTGDPTHRVELDGECTGLASLDDQVIAFTANSIQAIVGGGPNDQGVGSFDVRTVSIGVGCTNARSVVETDLGVFFQSRSQWYLLPRGLGAPQYIGDAIQEEETSFPVCLGATVNRSDNGHFAMFLVESDDGTEQAVLVYDLAAGQWTKDTYPASMALIGSWPADDFGLVLCAETLTGSPIFIEDDAELGDGSAHITASIETNIVKPAGPAGWGQFKTTAFVVDPLAASQTLVARISVDGGTAETFQTAAAGAGISASPSYRYIVPATNKGTGALYTLEDAAVSGVASAGFEWIALAIEYSPDGGLRLVQPAER